MEKQNYFEMITATVWATACLPVRQGAITFEEREALPYNEAAVVAAQQAKQKQSLLPLCGCPGSQVKR